METVRFVKVTDDGQAVCYGENKEKILQVFPRLVKIVRCLIKIANQFGTIEEMSTEVNPGRRNTKLLLGGFEIRYVMKDSAHLAIHQRNGTDMKPVFSLWSDVDSSSLSDWDEKKCSQISWFDNQVEWIDDLEKIIINLDQLSQKKISEFVSASRSVVEECAKIMAE